MSQKQFSEQELLARISELESELKKSKPKKYGLVWEEHQEDVVLQCQNNVPILKEVKNRKVSDNTNSPTNVLIEGDNYHALSVLNYTHKGKIDVIYIDPPYNTGNKDFIYNDNYIDREDSYRHSKWISFMEKRLKLAKQLLSERGVVFISIDDNEYAQLKVLCDEIFGEDNGENNTEAMIWHKVGDGDAGAGKMKVTYRFRREHEYILCCYKKRSEVFFKKFLSLPNFKNQYTNPDNDPRGPFKAGNISQSGDMESVDPRYKNCYEVTSPSGKKIIRKWHFSEELFNKLNNDNRIYWGKKGSSVPGLKIFTELPRETTPISLLQGLGSATSANKFMVELFGEKTFDNPKPVDLIHFLLKISSNINSIILDFMAGSGTTGHAVMELNKEDGGNRQFILCTNNENNICEEVTYERLKRVMKGYKNKKGEKVDGLGGNLRYFKTELFDVGKISRVTDDKKLALTYRVGGLLALKENTFEEVEHTDHWQIFREHDKSTAVYFSEDKTKLHELITELGSYDVPVKLYVFSWSKNEYASELSDYPHIAVLDIPEPILAVYREINNL